MSTRASNTDTRAQGGLTLIELMVTLAVLSILILVAAPAFREAIMNVRMSALANDLMADLALARSEAIKQGRTVMICPSPAPHTACSGTDWKVGWMVFVDADNDGRWDNTAAERGFKSREPAPTAATWTITTANIPTAAPGSTAYLRYRATGVSLTTAVDQTITLCDGRADIPNRGRVITISPTGRPVVTRVTC